MSSCALQSKAVHISGISYTDLTGSSATPVAINLNCSSTVSCDGLTFDTIQISSASKGQKDTSVLSTIVAILVLSASVYVVLADFNVLNYGAVGDGKTEDSQAFVKAWAATCGSTDGSVTMVVPEGKTFLMYPNMFNGPCKPSSITVTIAGTIMAPDTTDKWQGIDASLWLGFNNVNGVTINGNGNFNGRGLNWWNQSCRVSGDKPGVFTTIVVTLSLAVTASANPPTFFSVVDFGAAGDGETDDSQAFLKAWRATCDVVTGLPTMIVPPHKTFLVKPVNFAGPCKSINLSFQILGNVVAPNTSTAWKGFDARLWLTFRGVIGLTVNGSGLINGMHYFGTCVVLV
ncbi:Polygalacturonase ADPG1 [Acorus calamus]|uniref:Polygalacturonase ADPG1 n=1 Tax=Acorus calamus TaxID=4465 RepID=A0AAV9BZV9_ACOCL|nr:Polygalacturonase ADPG1 [Acorus calamus]